MNSAPMKPINTMKRARPALLPHPCVSMLPAPKPRGPLGMRRLTWTRPHDVTAGCTVCRQGLPARQIPSANPNVAADQLLRPHVAVRSHPPDVEHTVFRDSYVFDPPPSTTLSQTKSGARLIRPRELCGNARAENRTYGTPSQLA